MISTKSLVTWGWLGGDGAIPDPPTNIGVTSLTTSVLLVSWDFTSYAGGFDLYRSTSLSGTFVKVNTSPILFLSYYDGQENTPLNADTVYYYKVKALGPTHDTDSAFSGIASGKTLSSSESGNIYYYPETIRCVTVALLDMFNDFWIKRYTSAPAKGSTVVKSVRVPIMFGPVEKRHADELRDGKEGFQAPPVPRMSLVFNGLDYDASRASGVNEIRSFYDSAIPVSNLDQFFTDVNPTPYNYSFTLSLLTESIGDYSQILENILPYFNPTRYLRVKEFQFLNIERDLPVKLGNVTQNFSDSIDISEKRKIGGDIELTVNGWMYRPIGYAKLIKTINVNYLINNNIVNDTVIDEYGVFRS